MFQIVSLRRKYIAKNVSFDNEIQEKIYKGIISEEVSFVLHRVTKTRKYYFSFHLFVSSSQLHEQVHNECV